MLRASERGRKLVTTILWLTPFNQRRDTHAES